jgi:hypothetical protein
LARDVAVHLLCPASLLETAFYDALPKVSAHDGTDKPLEGDPNVLWHSDAGQIITAVAVRLGVPNWVAVRRLADEALLDEEALYYADGVIA